MEEFWKFWQNQKQNYEELTTWWDMGKKHIQSMSIIYCNEKQKQIKRNLRDITNKIEKEKKENNPNPQQIYNKGDLHGGKTTMLYLNLSGH